MNIYWYVSLLRPLLPGARGWGRRQFLDLGRTWFGKKASFGFWEHKVTDLHGDSWNVTKVGKWIQIGMIEVFSHKYHVIALDILKLFFQHILLSNLQITTAACAWVYNFMEANYFYEECLMYVIRIGKFRQAVQTCPYFDPGEKSMVLPPTRFLQHILIEGLYDYFIFWSNLLIQGHS